MVEPRVVPLLYRTEEATVTMQRPRHVDTSVSAGYRNVVNIEAMMRRHNARKKATKRSKHGFANQWRGMEAPGSSRNVTVGILSAIKAERTGTRVTDKVITADESARNSNTPHVNNYIIGGH